MSDPARYNFEPAPAELDYLVEPALRYGRRYQFDDAVQAFLEQGDEADFACLAALAERVRLSGHYTEYLRWSYRVDDTIEQIVDQRHPYPIRKSRLRPELLALTNESNDPPELVARLREKRLRFMVEAKDRSALAKRREQLRTELSEAANNQVHHTDMYFLFGLFDACDLAFQ